MSASERLDSKAGPLGNLSQTYFGGLDMMVKGYEPALKGIGRWNLEVFGFMARRAQAWIEIPSRLSQCKTPVDLFNAQGKFLQAAAADYADSSKRLVAAWGACAAMPKLNGAQPRDYITFPEPQETPAAPKRGERKAA
jgi:phasin protein